MSGHLHPSQQSNSQEGSAWNSGAGGAVSPEVLAQWLSEAEGVLRAGRFPEAESAFRQILAAAPLEGRAWRGLGLLALQTGQPAVALPFLQKAAACGWEDGLLIASALRQAGRPEEAVGKAQEALTREPDSAALWNELASDLFLCKRYEEAREAIAQALQRKPEDALALNNLGMIEAARYCMQEALEAFDRALQLRPQDALTRRNAGLMRLRLGRVSEAIPLLQEAIRQQPEQALFGNDLATALLDHGRFSEAVAVLRDVLKARPGYPEALQNLLCAGDRTVAEEALREVAADQRVRMQMDLNVMHGRLREAEECCRKLLALPDLSAQAHSACLMTMHYLPGYGAAALAAAHREWATRHLPAALQKKEVAGAFFSPPEGLGGRRLRVGYLSPDLRRHSVASFLEPVLREHDRFAVEVFCYFDYRAPDPVTLRLRPLAEHWRDVAGLTDEALRAQVMADGVDVLVDLAGHTGRRLLMLALRAAPVQMTWLGYPDTTGVPAMDYRLTDAEADPEGAEGHCSEVLLRLPSPFLCFQPSAAAPEIGPLPSADGAVFTFGSLNNLPKVSDACVKLWSAVLRAVPESRLILKSRGFIDAGTRAYTEARFAAEGIAPQRLVLFAYRADSAHHLSVYNEIDLGLDSFPYHGTTTTCEALWMGVPVVTRLGDCHMSRVGASLLRTVGLPELVAGSEEEFVAIATRLACDRPRLARLRAGMRARLLASPLLDAPRFTRHLEHVFLESVRQKTP